MTVYREDEKIDEVLDKDLVREFYKNYPSSVFDEDGNLPLLSDADLTEYFEAKRIFLKELEIRKQFNA